jgi:phage tail-like protein
VLPDGSVLVLDRCPRKPFSNIYRLVNGQQAGQPVSTAVFGDLVDPSNQSQFQLTGHDFAFVPIAGLTAACGTAGTGASSVSAVAAVAAAVTAGSVLGTLTVAGSDGFQAFAFDLSIQNGQLTLAPQGDYLPMRGFGGMGLAASPAQVYYDSDPGWVPLVAQKRPRYVFGATLQTPAQRQTQAGAPAQGFFDGRDPGCIWHRVMLDAAIPPGTSVTIWSRAADDPGDLASTAWELEPSPYLRDNGSELPFLPPPRPPSSGPAYNGTWELLLQHAVGRYLQLQIEVIGDGRDTPRLRALRAYYPRFSYLKHYLPGCYGDQPVPASFLERYLANVEGFYTALEDKVTNVSMLLDSRSVPAAAIDWLISWFGVTANPNWSEANSRLFIKYAMTLFQYRGTVRGLRMALALVLDACPDEGLFMTPPRESQYAAKTRVVEGWQTRLTPGVVFGDPSASAGLRQVPQAALWGPTQGGSSLSSRYAAALNQPQGTVYPIRDPGGALSAGWQQFSSVTLGFVPSATDADQPTWSAYLRRRYASLAALNGEYGQSWANFSTVPVPNALPPDGAPLVDWFQFEGVVLPTRRAAHQFTVLLPVPQNALFDITTQNQQLGLAQQVIASEKPAHTVFQVKFYYVLFQVGSARLGQDTSLEQGSRSPYLMPPMVLGSGFLSESYLAPQFPLPAPGRRVIGRGRLKAGSSAAPLASAAPTSSSAVVWTGDRS